MNKLQVGFVGMVIGFFVWSGVYFLAEKEWIDHARKSKAECEENIPRKEVCVPVFFPRSKD